MYFLQNEHLSVRVAAKGAELQSIFSKKTQLEYIWQPGEETWPHHSMLLFPNPGRIAHDRVIIGGKVYPASMHGFANDMPFTLVEQTDTSLTLQLQDTEFTRSRYPYRFRLQVTFSLEGDTLVQTFRVVNDGAEDLYYCLGAHPGFYCPIELGESAENYKLVFDRPQRLRQQELEENTRLLTGKETLYLQDEDTIPLCDRFFDGGPMLFGGMDANTVTLKSDVSGRFVEFGIAGFHDLCLWGVPTRMSLIAIEPWIGTTDRRDTDHVWEHKPGVQCIAAGKTGTHTLTFRVG